MAIVEGKQVKVGDWVGFKCDIEQAGRIVKIKGSMLTLYADRDEGFEGDYIGGDMYTVEHASRCWLY